MANAGPDVSLEFGKAKSAFRSNPNRGTARRFLLAWADHAGSRDPANSEVFLRKLASDRDYCLAFVDAEVARFSRAWADVASAGARLEAARDRVNRD